MPMGDYKDPNILDVENLEACSLALQEASINVAGFEYVPPLARHFYYFDPPYHKTFTNYNAKGFTEQDQATLAHKCREIDRAGGFFMLSNSDTPLIRDLFRGFNVDTVAATRSVSRQSDQRGRTNELVINNYR